MIRALATMWRTPAWCWPLFSACCVAWLCVLSHMAAGGGPGVADAAFLAQGAAYLLVMWAGFRRGMRV